MSVRTTFKLDERTLNHIGYLRGILGASSSTETLRRIVALCVVLFEADEIYIKRDGELVQVGTV